MTIAATGVAAIGETFTATLGNTTGLAGFLVGAPVAYTPPGCGTCVVGADEALLLGSQLAVPVPGNPALVGVQLAIEGVQLLAGPGPCLGQFDLSNTIDVTIR